MLLARCTATAATTTKRLATTTSRALANGVGNQWPTLERKAKSIMSSLTERNETVGLAETSTGGLVSAALWSSPVGGSRIFKGAGVRLSYGIDRDADARGVAEARAYLNGDSTISELERRTLGAGWPLVYEKGDEHSETGSAAHALELAHAAKLNLRTTWGIGESGVPGPEAHRRTGVPPGMGFVAVAGPSEETTGVLKIGEAGGDRGENMARFAGAALDLMLHLQGKRR